MKVHRAMRLLPAAAVALAVVTVLHPATADTVARPTAPTLALAPTLAWTDCGGGLRCATAAVPLDYDRPHGATINLAVAQLPATDPAHRLGTLFVAPPGSTSGVAFLRALGATLFTAEVRARFDLVAFDRRGVGGSAPVRCFATGAEENAFVAAMPYFPVGAQEVRALGATLDDYARRCTARSGDRLPHVSSTDVARDLDVLRAAVGDARLTYVGYSWSAYVGAIYANLFPQRVRAIVYDGPQYAPDFGTGRPGTAPFSRTNADLGAEESLARFFQDCRTAGPDRCVFAGGGDPAVKYEQLLNRLRRGPLHQPLPDWPAEFSLDDAIGLTASALFSGDFYGYLAESLQTLYAAATGTPAPARRAGARSTATPRTLLRSEPGPDQEPYPNGFDALTAMACADLDRPDSADSTEAAARRRAAVAPHFGHLYAWYVGQCATFPGPSRDRYLGPWTPPSGPRGLVVGMRYDPIAWYGGVARYAALIQANLLTVVDGRGHLSLGKSTCADTTIGRYLVDGALTDRTSQCQADREPFPA